MTSDAYIEMEMEIDCCLEPDNFFNAVAFITISNNNGDGFEYPVLTKPSKSQLNSDI